MSLNSLIISTLSILNIPVRFHKLLDSDGTPDTYITFFEFNQNGKLHGDDQEIKSSHSVQIDIWSKGNYSSVVKKTKEILISIGFTRTYETEFYETDTKLYHKVIRFNFVQ